MGAGGSLQNNNKNPEPPPLPPPFGPFGPGGLSRFSRISTITDNPLTTENVKFNSQIKSISISI